jgi:hypothetical protein
MKNGFYKLVATVLASLILVLPGTVSARERRGADIVITLKDGQQIKGKLIAVNPNSLLILAGKDESVDLIGIRSIRIVIKSKARLGGACGLLAGALISGLSDTNDPLPGGARLAIVAGGVLGGLIGLGAGALASSDKTIQLEGKSESEVRKALAYLRKKSRIRDYK